MALQFKSEEEAREWLRKTKAAGKQQTAESVPLNEFIAPTTDDDSSPDEKPAAPEHNTEESSRVQKEREALRRMKREQPPKPPKTHEVKTWVKPREVATAIFVPGAYTVAVLTFIEKAFVYPPTSLEDGLTWFLLSGFWSCVTVGIWFLAMTLLSPIISRLFDRPGYWITETRQGPPPGWKPPVKLTPEEEMEEARMRQIRWNQEQMRQMREREIESAIRRAQPVRSGILGTGIEPWHVLGAFAAYKMFKR